MSAAQQKPKVIPVDEIALIIRSSDTVEDAAESIMERLAEYVEMDIGYLQTNWALAEVRADRAIAELKRLKAKSP